MGFIAGFIEFLRWIGAKNLLIIILGTGLFFFIRSTYFNRQVKRIPITSLFKKIEYVKQLRLVSYYYEELLAIGTSDRLQSLVDQAETDSINAEQAVVGAMFVRDRSRANMETAIAKYEASKNFLATDTILIKLRKQLVEAEARFNIFKISGPGKQNKVIGQLKNNPNVFGPEIKQKFDAYKTAEDDFIQNKKKLKSSERKAKRRVIENAAKTLMASFELEQESLKAERDFQEGLLEETEKGLKKAQQSYREESNIAKRAFREAENELADTEKDLEEKKARLNEARGELLKVSGESEPVPRLLVIASAKVTGMVDLDSLVYRIEGPDSITVTKFPKAILDSIEIELPEDKRYLIDDSRERNRNEKGLYYEVYKQLKEAIGEAENRVRLRATDSGILDDTHELARQYVIDFGRSMGYGVGFAGDLPAPNIFGTESVAEVETDSVRLRVEETLDSLAVELEAKAAESVLSDSVSTDPSGGNN